MNSRSMTFLGIGAAMILLWFFVLYAPLTREHHELDKKIIEAREQLDDFDRTMRELPGFLETQRNLEQFKADLNSSLYAKADILSLLARIESDASNLRLEIVEITPPIEELLELNRSDLSPEKPQFLNLTLNIKGRFVQFGKFVSVLEEAVYFRGINHCLVSGSRLGDAPENYSIGFRALLTAGSMTP